RNDRVEGIVGKSQVAGIHFMEAGNVRQSFGFDALARLFEHLGREIDADDIEVLLIVGKGETGSYANLEHAAAAAVDDLDSVAPAGGGHRTERIIVNRCPAAIGVAHGALVKLHRLWFETPSRCARPRTRGAPKA